MRLSFLKYKRRYIEPTIEKSIGGDSLVELVNNNLSDKNTVHKYLDVYET